MQEERVAAAMAEKDEGNRLHAQAKYKEAAAHYTEALRLAPPLHPSRAIFYSNRAACRLVATPSPVRTPHTPHHTPSSSPHARTITHAHTSLASVGEANSSIAS